MANSYTNIVVFFLTTLVYYFALKPKVKLEDFESEESVSSSHSSVVIYFLLILVTQFFVNSYVITSICGNNFSDNLKNSALYTFIPWILIFGAVIAVLLVFPGFKSAFSDVIGYYYVSSSANSIITELLVNQDIEKIIDTNGSDTASGLSEQNNQSSNSDSNGDDLSSPNDTTLSVSSSDSDYNKLGNINTEQMNVNLNDNNSLSNEKDASLLTGGKRMLQKGGTKEQMQKAADLIVKICGNMSILINQLSPTNFNEYWNILKPLFKDKYKNDASSAELKNNLFDLVVTRDNVGESMWYIYTGILVSSISQFKISQINCNKTSISTKTANNAVTTTPTNT
jgi:hypothetical protein